MTKKVPIFLGFAPIITMVLSLYLIPLPWLAAWYGAMLLHEMGHMIAVMGLGGRIYAIRIQMFGCRISCCTPTELRSIICILAGPLAGLCPLLIARFVPRIAICGLFQSIYNLLPIANLDGGRILKILINKHLRENFLAKSTGDEYNRGNDT